MRKFYFKYNTSCPYKLKVGIINEHSWYKDSIIGLADYCNLCEYHVDRVIESFEKIKGHVVCKYLTFDDKLKIVKELIK